MDILAHGLWSGAACSALNKRREANGNGKLSVRQAVFWGIFPDFFAFSAPFAIIFWNIFFGGLTWADFPKPTNTEPPEAAALLVMDLAVALYNISHSLVIFSAIFFAAYLIFKKPRIEMLAWMLHILIDIPTHTAEFFPTPVFWPVFGWKFGGISWSEPWFAVLNYGALILVFAWLRFGSRRKRRLPEGENML